MKSKKSIYYHLLDATLEVEKKLNDSLEETCSALDKMKVDYAGSGLEAPSGVTKDYWSSSVRSKLPNILAYLEVYAFIISNAIPQNKEFEEITILDYGGGAGYMSLLAKQVGIGKVFYHDRDPGVQRRAQIIGEITSLEADKYLCGTEDILLEYPETFNSIVSSDVLEHVYSIENVIKCWSIAATKGAKMFHQTGANYKNLHQRWYLSKMHRNEEARYILKSRKDFINKSFPTLSEKEVNILAEKTRGLNSTDINIAVENFLNQKILPEPDHPTNTCELSGYWIERFMEPKKVASECRKHGFKTEVKGTKWGIGRSSFLPATIKKFLNLLAGISLWFSLRVTFYYCISAEKETI